MIVSIIHKPGLTYPSIGEIFSEKDRCATDHTLLGLSNHSLFNAFHNVLFQVLPLSPDITEYIKWNPLGKYIKPGMKVFILCNFVFHRRPGESELDFQGKCTHGSVVAAVLEYCLRAVGKEGTVFVGNAPLQSCDWPTVFHDTGVDKVINQCQQKGYRVIGRDLRLFVTRLKSIGTLKFVEERESTNGIEIDLGESILLDELYTDETKPKFRITDYDPKRIEAFHRRGSHRYIIHRQILESDVIIHIPKLKTHEKVGVTLGIKGCVGTIGHKDCLAHHRFGSPNQGGDEYPENWSIKVMNSKLHDFVFSSYCPWILKLPLQVMDRGIRRLIRMFDGVLAGAWHGNDTAWRMALDMARILHYADKYGELKSTRQRESIMFVDGIVGGEGEGPLSPQGVKSSILIFSDNIALGDKILCRLMGYDPDDIPIIREAFRLMKFGLIQNEEPIQIVFNGKMVSEDELYPVLGRPFRSPKGWTKYLLKEGSRNKF